MNELGEQDLTKLLDRHVAEGMIVEYKSNCVTSRGAEALEDVKRGNR
jgi:hypothetical protein